MDIHTWLENFRKYWINHDVEGVLKLFADNVEYFESPFIKLTNQTELFSSWNEIYKQENIVLTYDVFASKADHFAVKWDLKYDHSGVSHHFAGTYFIRLNEQNVCTYFYHCCESEKK